MKLTATITTGALSLIVLAGCSLKKAPQLPEYDIDAEAAYYNDMLDAMGDDSVADESLDDSVRPHVTGPALENMTQRKFVELDTDKSGAVSEQEFVAYYERRKSEDKSITPDVLAAKIARLKAEFAKYAGEDKALSKDELKALLEKEGHRVSGHRRKHREAEAQRKAEEQHKSGRTDDSTHTDDRGGRGEAESGRRGRGRD